MRLLLLALLNLGALVRSTLAAPFRLFARRRRPAYVQFRVEGDLPYRREPKGRWPFRKRPDPAVVASLADLRDAIDRIVRDVRVLGVVFDIRSLRAGPSKRAAIAEMVDGLRAAGKRTLAYGVSLSGDEYEVACLMDEVVVAPGGRLDVTGFSAEATALASWLDRVGIGAAFVRRGDYKTAPELFTHKAVSDIQRSTVEGLLDERYRELVRLLETRRRLDVEDAKRVIDQGPYGARRAKARGLCDELCQRSELPALLMKRHPNELRRRWIGSYPDYRRTLFIPPKRFRRMRRSPLIAVVPVAGMIVEGEGGRPPIGPSLVGAEAVVEALRRVGREPSDAVVLHVASPGGSATASEVILDELRRLAERKPVVAFADRVMASGGYLAALGGREIWATPHALIGSIGVFAGKLEVSRLLTSLGISREVIRRGANSAIFSATQPLQPSELEALELEVEETYRSFVDQVAAARRSTPEEIHTRAEGRVYSGNAALDAGLIDRTGGFEDACRRALELAGKRTEHFEVTKARLGGRRFPFARAFQAFSELRIYALWSPYFGMSGSDGHQDTAVE